MYFRVMEPPAKDPTQGKRVKTMADQTISILNFKVTDEIFSETFQLRGQSENGTFSAWDKWLVVSRKAWSTCLAPGSWYVTQQTEKVKKVRCTCKMIPFGVYLNLTLGH